MHLVRAMKARGFHVKRRLKSLRSASNPLHRKLFPEKLRRFSTSIHARAAAAVLGSGVTLAGAYFGYRWEKDPLSREEKIINQSASEVEPPQVVTHPYEHTPLLWRLFFKVLQYHIVTYTHHATILYLVVVLCTTQQIHEAPKAAFKAAFKAATK